MKSKKLTVKQKLFADEYIKTGNATEAAIKAGYSKKSARFTGAENLTKPNIKAYIDKQMQEIESHKIADAKEAMKSLTSIARQEPQPNGELPTVTEAYRAWQEILKRYPLNDMSKAQIRKANAEARSAELDAEIKQAQLDSMNRVADKSSEKMKNLSEKDLRKLVEMGDEATREADN